MDLAVGFVFISRNRVGIVATGMVPESGHGKLGRNAMGLSV